MVIFWEDVPASLPLAEQSAIQSRFEELDQETQAKRHSRKLYPHVVRARAATLRVQNATAEAISSAIGVHVDTIHR